MTFIVPLCSRQMFVKMCIDETPRSDVNYIVIRLMIMTPTSTNVTQIVIQLDTPTLFKHLLSFSLNIGKTVTTVVTASTIVSALLLLKTFPRNSSLETWMAVTLSALTHGHLNIVGATLQTTFCTFLWNVMIEQHYVLWDNSWQMWIDGTSC